MNRQLEMVDKFVKAISKLDEVIETLDTNGYMTEMLVLNKLVKVREEMHDGMIQHIKNSKEYEGLVDSEYYEDDFLPMEKPPEPKIRSKFEGFGITDV